MITYYRLDLYDDGEIKLEKTTEEECNGWENHRCYFSDGKGSGISVFGDSLIDCYKRLKTPIIRRIENKQKEIKKLETLLSKIETKENKNEGCFEI